MRLTSLVFVLRACLFSLCLLVRSCMYGQQKSKGFVERFKVHGKNLEGNLSGDSADRYVSVYLPPGYKKNAVRRYPVVYFLHGYTDDDARFYGFTNHWMNLVHVLDSVFAAGLAQEMIVVTPNAYTRFQGSMYSNSVTTGNWEDYIAQELVTYIDSHYRTIAKAGSRGITGHSMGGYGALRIGEKNPAVFSSVYLLSPCCLSNQLITDVIPSNMLRADSVKTLEAFQQSDFGTRIVFASAAAWSPNPDRPPFYVDLPVKDGKLDPIVLAKWTANKPLVDIDQYISNLKKLKAIGFDAGDKDRGIAASIQELDTVLNIYGIKHSFEIYDGNHTNKVADRMAGNMLRFFSSNLSFK
jgi:S-formylglutathione hydrolase